MEGDVSSCIYGSTGKTVCADVWDNKGLGWLWNLLILFE